MIGRAALVLLLIVAEAGAAELRSGYDDAGPQTRATQDDDTVNPGFLWVQQGAALWSQPAGAAGTSCASCHEISAMRGVAARYPAFDTALGRPMTLDQRIEQCRTERQKASPLPPEDDTRLALSAYVGLQSRGMTVRPRTDGPMRPFLEAGRTLYMTRQGQLNLSCSNCHDGLAGQRLGGALIPQGHANGYPLYRLEWQGMGSVYRRIRNCLTGIRAEIYPPDAPELTALELYLAARATGLKVETPAVRP